MLVILNKIRNCGFSDVLLLWENVICVALMRPVFLSASQQLSWWQLSVLSECFLFHTDNLCEEKIFSEIKDRISVQKMEDNKMPGAYGLEKVLIIKDYRGEQESSK